MQLTAVILAKTDSEELFRMTSDCIRTLLESEPETALEIILVESNKNYAGLGFHYPESVTIIIPEIPFNFHKFLNIGIKASAGTYIALCNNDLIFHPNWFSEMMQVQALDPAIRSFSPYNPASNFPEEMRYQKGYKVRTHVNGWCIVAHKSVLKKIGNLDEQFDFYYADNDYAMTLKHFNIGHAVVVASKVDHLEKRSTAKTAPEADFLEKYTIPDYLKTEKYGWVLQNEKNLSSFLKFHGKWGHPDWLYKKNKLTNIFIKFGIGFLNRFVL